MRYVNVWNTLGEHHAPSQLLNIYYETPDAWLRGHDMGLRIRVKAVITK